VGTPLSDPLLGLCQQQLAQLTQALNRTQKRAVALKLLELTADEQTLSKGHRPVDLVNQCRLADSRVASHEESTRIPLDHTSEGGHQRRQFLLAPIETVRLAGREGQVVFFQPYRHERLIQGQCRWYCFSTRSYRYALKNGHSMVRLPIRPYGQRADQTAAASQPSTQRPQQETSR
jgi:hypothetical protein